MRLSIYENELHEYADARIYLDGVKRDHVVAADEEALYIDIVCLDESGWAIVEGDKIKTQRLHGIVRIEFPESKSGANLAMSR